MRKLEIVEKIKCFIWDHPYIPKIFKEDAKGPLLLHISDTPSEIFPFIKKLIKEINPQYIVHTGDIVDNIKLETDIRLLKSYGEELPKMVTMLQENSKAKIYYALGNHDHEATLKKSIKNGYVMNKGILNIHGCRIYINHYYEEPPVAVDYYLYGHNFEPNFIKNNMVGLNGLLKVNVIDLSSKKNYQIKYPIATNRFRKMEKGKITI